jgi:hypothetical protein
MSELALTNNHSLTLLNPMVVKNKRNVQRHPHFNNFYQIVNCIDAKMMFSQAKKLLYRYKNTNSDNRSFHVEYILEQ